MKAAKLISDRSIADSTENEVKLTGASVRRLREFFGLSQAQFARFFGATAKSVANWERGRPMPAHARQTMTMLADIQDRLVNLIRPEFIGIWLRKPNQALGGLSPLEAIERGKADRIYRLLVGLEEGLHA